jgi:hypothetical protein
MKASHKTRTTGFRILETSPHPVDGTDCLKLYIDENTRDTARFESREDAESKMAEVIRFNPSCISTTYKVINAKEIPTAELRNA